MALANCVEQITSESFWKIYFPLFAGSPYLSRQSASLTPKYCHGSKISPSIDLSRIHAAGLGEIADFIKI